MLADTEATLCLTIILLLECDKEFIVHLLPFFFPPAPFISAHRKEGVSNGNVEIQNGGNGNLKISDFFLNFFLSVY